MYSAMSKKGPLTTVNVDGTVQVKHIAPYWTVMLADRDHAQMVNMIPYMEEYKFAYPVAKHYGEVKHASTMHLKLPFLTNKTDLVPGNLLVLPFDAGMSEICCETFPPIEPSKKMP